MAQFPTLVIGLGGSGIKSVVAFKRMLKEKGEYEPDRIKFLGFDCNGEDVRKFSNDLEQTELHFYGMRNVKAMIESPRSRPYMDFVTMVGYPPNADLGANMYRQISRACLFSQIKQIHDMIELKINELLSLNPKGSQAQVDTVIISSVCGGAGSGILIDIAANVRYLYEKNVISGDINAILVSGDVYSKFPQIKVSEQRLLANTYAVMKDLQKLQTDAFYSNNTLSFKYSDNFQIDINRRPLDIIFLIEAHTDLGNLTLINQNKLTAFISSTLYLMYCTDIHASMKADLMAPGAGFAEVNNSHSTTRVQKVWSSIGYFKLFYPRDEIINYVKFSLGEEIIKSYYSQFFMDLSEEEKRESRTWTQNRYIEKYVPKLVDYYNWEYEDFENAIRHDVREVNVNTDAIESEIAKICAKEKWDDIMVKLDAQKETLIQSLSRTKESVENYTHSIFTRFISDITDLPLILLEKRIGIKYLNETIEGLMKEFDREESEAKEALQTIIKERDIFEGRFNDAKNLILDLHKNKPLLGGRGRMRDLVPEFVSHLSAYLQRRVSELILESIIALFKQIDTELNGRMQKVGNVVKKFGEVHDIMNKQLTEAKIDIELLFGKANHSEISVITKEKCEEILHGFLERNKPNSIMRNILISGKANNDFWIFSEQDSHTPEMIYNKVLDEISPLLTELNLTLVQAIEAHKLEVRDIKTRFANESKNVSPQWMFDGKWLGLNSVKHYFQTCPAELRQEFPDINIKSSSPHNLEVLLFDCALPPQALQYIKLYKQNYDKETTIKPNSLHINPEAELWPELIDFTDESEVLMLFAVGLAYGQIYEPTEQELDFFTNRLGNKSYRGFIFTNRLWYILMPYFKLGADGRPDASVATLADVKLGQGRLNAYNEFKANPRHQEAIRQWIGDRIVGRDYNLILEALKDYQVRTYNRRRANPKDDQGLNELMKLESIEFAKYIEQVTSTKDPTL